MVLLVICNNALDYFKAGKKTSFTEFYFFSWSTTQELEGPALLDLRYQSSTSNSTGLPVKLWRYLIIRKFTAAIAFMKNLKVLVSTLAMTGKNWPGPKCLFLNRKNLPFPGFSFETDNDHDLVHKKSHDLLNWKFSSGFFYLSCSIALSRRLALQEDKVGLRKNIFSAGDRNGKFSIPEKNSVGLSFAWQTFIIYTSMKLSVKGHTEDDGSFNYSNRTKVNFE